MTFDANLIIVLVSALAAAASFAAFAMPFQARKEKKERYRDVIEKKRKALFEQAHLVAQRAHGQVQSLGGARHVARARGGHEHLQRIERSAIHLE